MPRLCRLRLISVGHPGARFHDVTLDFRDAHGEPTDSTVWLRNGGGKTSLLSLFFSLLRPDKREFLGLRQTGKAEEKANTLKDYVLPEDRSVLVSEWALDGGQGLFGLETSPHFLAGVFCERKSGEEELQRLFFSARVEGVAPPVTIDTLPLWTSADQRARRTLQSFRQEWQAVRTGHPHTQAASTDNQREWAGLLEDVGIDTELFAYQVKMNRREGGADELFRFSDHEKFIDFLLEVALETEFADKLSRNLSDYRQQLLQRKEQLLPEQELVSGLLRQLAPIDKLAERRGQLLGDAARVGNRFESLRGHVALRMVTLAEQAENGLQTVRQKTAQASAMAAQADAAHRQAAALRRFSARLRRDRAGKEEQRLKEQRDGSYRRKLLHEAALPLRTARQCERQAAELRRELGERQRDHAPLLADLQKAAQELKAALLWRAAELRSLQQSLGDQEAAARKTNQEALRLQAACEKETARLQGEETRHHAALQQAQAQRERLVQRGTLQPDESGIQAETRLAQELADGRAHSLTLTQQSADAGRLQSAASIQHAEAQEDERSAKAHLESLDKTLQQAQKRRRELEEDELLNQLLEVAAVDLELLPDGEPELLTRAAHGADQELVLQRLTQIEDERAVSHLDQSSLLPPPVAVGQVLSVLRERLGRVWSGFEYLATNRPDNAARRAELAVAPYLWSGVLVSDTDFAAAQQLLAGMPPPELPVVIASLSALPQNPPPANGFIVCGPASDAYFDKTSGQKELDRRRERLERSTRLIAQHTKQRDAIKDLGSRLRAFRRDFPVGWFATQTARSGAAQENLARCAEQVLRLKSAVAQAEQTISTLARQLKETASRVSAGETRLLQVKDFIQDHEQKLVTHQTALVSCQQARGQQEADAERWREEAEESLRQAERHQKDAQKHGEDARTQEDDAARVKYAPVTPEPQASDQPLSELRERHRHLSEVYEEKVGSDALSWKAEEAERQASQARTLLQQRLRRKDKDKETAERPLTELEVQRTLDAILPSDWDRLEEINYDIEQEHQRVHFQHLQQASEVARFKKELDAAETRCKELGLVVELAPAEQPEGPVQADDLASRLEETAVVQARDSAQYAQAAQEAEKKTEQHRLDRERLGKDRERLDSIAAGHARLLNQLPLTSEFSEVWLPPAGDEEVATKTREIEGQLITLGQRSDELDDQRRDQVTELRKFGREEKFQPLRSQIAHDITTAAENEVEAMAATWSELLETRHQVLGGQIADIGKHRDLLSQQVLSAADEGLQLLKSAAQHSQLPSGLPGLGGMQFLRIQFDVPSEPAERRARISQMLDEMISKNQLPGGLQLVQQAVQRLVRPVKVRVLHPEPDLTPRAYEIDEMARFSGGERLTCAILLYCTLAQLRARRRGVRRPSSTLILDNPVGSASRVRFLDMQRAMARALNVQLIYTTGINDYDAVATLPNILRMRNQRIDRRRGHRLVEAVPAETRGLDVARVGFETGTPDKQADDSFADRAGSQAPG